MSASISTDIRTPPTVITTFYTVETSEPMTFQWTKPMPNYGYLGTVTFRKFQKKPIQVFDPKPVVSYGVRLGISWAYQAQDGSFLCRMFVSDFGDLFITFSERKKGEWPLITVLAPHHSTLAEAGGQQRQTSSPES